MATQHEYDDGSNYFVMIEERGRYFFARTKAKRPNREHNIEWRHKHDDASQFTQVGAQETARRFRNARAAVVPVVEVQRVARIQRLQAQEMDAAE